MIQGFHLTSPQILHIRQNLPRRAIIVFCGECCFRGILKNIGNTEVRTDPLKICYHLAVRIIVVSSGKISLVLNLEIGVLAEILEYTVNVLFEDHQFHELHLRCSKH